MEKDDLILEGYMDYTHLKEMYQSGDIPSLNKHERELLEFCHGRDMRQYIKENVWDKPIVLNSDGSVNWEKTVFRSKKQEPPRPLFETPQPKQQTETPQIDKQKFYYLYDDEGNLVAALPKN